VLALSAPEEALSAIRSAGTVFLGGGGSVAHGDYLSGANHVLPTGGFARAFSGLSVLDFLRWTTWQRVEISYARGLAEAVASGRFDFAALAASPDDEARDMLVSLKGIGRWSAEVYLIFVLGRPDVWPAGDLGLQLAVMECLGLSERPREKELREIGEKWRPWRSVASCLFWQSYLHARNRAAPVLAPELYAVEEQ